MIDPKELGDWIETQLTEAWPEAELVGYDERDGNCDFRIGADTDHWLKLGYRIVLEGTNEELTGFLVESEWVSWLTEEECLFVGYEDNSPTLSPCE